MATQHTPILIRDGRLIDGNGGKPVENATVLIEGQRIRQVTTGKIEVPTEAKVIWPYPAAIDSSTHKIQPGRLNTRN